MHSTTSKPIHVSTCLSSEIINSYINTSHIIASIRYPEENLAFFWGLAHLETILHKNNNIKWVTVSYEKLLTDAENEWDRIYTRLSDSISNNTIPSSKSMTKPKEHAPHQQTHLLAWRKALSKKQVSNILNILSAMNIYTYSIEPEHNYQLIYNQRL